MSVDRKHLSVASGVATRHPDQDDLESAVYSALADSSHLDSSYIFVTARGSDITLAGWVPVQAEAWLAEEIALGTKGVHRVHNELSPDL
ncbi:BON domain-containing protein [Rhizobium bangladeshense]|uniref:BON domain-containing protein n=1 Tax=Rhizobium bangladeshense TaxID=1138189 RepID=A0ABS7LII5_9HYPH|nr:BON domain-containing protein [Rhizobium bangladeshense]MBX4871161.1 BON domain-containing protein [Rhizobium bangladeshense]MBX4871412.1 BON domain-containing protein [Rhizobium bangladeshense]MBX4882726.1 BON domain-containing protein [Rhizobium bangladeshense]MBX4901133.1 BON domain-containing protein [Rhizobium bangladeshense]MBX4915220.1 BON domain-containing protein [Rhizobium bangladeshense]